MHTVNATSLFILNLWIFYLFSLSVWCRRKRTHTHACRRPLTYGGVLRFSASEHTFSLLSRTNTCRELCFLNVFKGRCLYVENYLGNRFGTWQKITGFHLLRAAHTFLPGKSIRRSGLWKHAHFVETSRNRSEINLGRKKSPVCLSHDHEVPSHDNSSNMSQQNRANFWIRLLDIFFEELRTSNSGWGV